FSNVQDTSVAVISRFKEFHLFDETLENIDVFEIIVVDDHEKSAFLFTFFNEVELLREQKTYDFSFDSDNFNPFTKAMFIINSTLYGNSHIQTSGVLSEPEGKIIVEEFTDDHFKA